MIESHQTFFRQGLIWSQLYFQVIYLAEEEETLESAGTQRLGVVLNKEAVTAALVSPEEALRKEMGRKDDRDARKNKML